jgi:RimJ/RimL family protein N-acetyltransferase
LTGVTGRAPEVFATARLDAHRVTAADEAFLRAMFADPGVTATLGGPRDDARVREMLDRMTSHWDRTGFGTWILVERATGTPVGWVGLHETETGGPGGVELLYAVASTRWRRGYASEAGRAAVVVGHGPLGRDELVAFTLVDNVGSRSVMEHLGFVYDADVEHAGLPHVLYRRARGEQHG